MCEYSTDQTDKNRCVSLNSSLQFRMSSLKQACVEINFEMQTNANFTVSNSDYQYINYFSNFINYINDILIYYLIILKLTQGLG